eukprot:comp23092_c1_seq1/m.37088 comp23092_c1_seq1/g.37088  ORF comp23092_c1_seq1/g.37088 comp23092_c1_seq1/m.37088 type:complete len:469 (-) comp23092_c1_seq1:331-1737(-)
MGICLSTLTGGEGGAGRRSIIEGSIDSDGPQGFSTQSDHSSLSDEPKTQEKMVSPISNFSAIRTTSNLQAGRKASSKSRTHSLSRKTSENTSAFNSPELCRVRTESVNFGGKQTDTTSSQKSIHSSTTTAASADFPEQKRRRNTISHISDRTGTQAPTDNPREQMIFLSAAVQREPSTTQLHAGVAGIVRSAGRFNGWGNSLDEKEEGEFSVSSGVDKNGKKVRRSNSCSSLYVDTTLTKPEMDDILACVSRALHSGIVAGHESGEGIFLDIFDERIHPLMFQALPQNYDSAPPTEMDVFNFLCSIFKNTLLMAENVIITMIYVERIVARGDIALQALTWKRVVLGGALLASKVWDDQAVWNVDFCSIFPSVTTRSINQLEAEFLEHMSYHVGVTAAVYAKYYFDLREFAPDRERIYNLLPLDLKRAKKLEALTMKSEEAYNSQYEIDIKRIQSDKPFQPRKNVAVIS